MMIIVITIIIIIITIIVVVIMVIITSFVTITIISIIIKVHPAAVRCDMVLHQAFCAKLVRKTGIGSEVRHGVTSGVSCETSWNKHVTRRLHREYGRLFHSSLADHITGFRDGS